MTPFIEFLQRRLAEYFQNNVCGSFRFLHLAESTREENPQRRAREEDDERARNTFGEALYVLSLY